MVHTHVSIHCYKNIASHFTCKNKNSNISQSPFAWRFQLVVPTFFVGFSVVRCDICNSVQIDSVGFFFPNAKLVRQGSPAGIMYTCVIFNVENYMTVTISRDPYYNTFFYSASKGAYIFFFSYWPCGDQKIFAKATFLKLFCEVKMTV